MKTVDLLRLKSLINIYRNQGHQIATLDPLHREWGSYQHGSYHREWGSRHWVSDPEAICLRTMMESSATQSSSAPASINLEAGGFSSEVTAETVVPDDCLVEILGPHWSSKINVSGTFDRKTVGNILETMDKSYCRTVSAEYTHVQTGEQFNWLSNALETHRIPTREERLRHYDLLVRTDR